jgi:cytochrome c-type biogenesis protein
VLSPCVFPLLPVYAGYLGGRAGQPGEVPGRLGRLPMLANGVSFVAGFTTVFIALFYVLEALEIGLFAQHRRVIDIVAGAIVIVFALQLMGLLRVPALMREVRWHRSTAPRGLIPSFLLGVSFAAGWTPCIGPQLTAILQLAVAGSLGGLPFMLIYCLGLAVPFLAIALLAERLRPVLAAVNARMGLVSLIGGVLLLLFGLLLVTGTVTYLNGLSPSAPFDL